ncbi:MAG: hypothetical protein Rpha_2039 [Candidatus Ruthia sp. Apha_13_S6]|nr:hypothetical protein [Candidatus Ruthia sp. Apha_13_S6]
MLTTFITAAAGRFNNNDNQNQTKQQNLKVSRNLAKQLPYFW